VNKLATILFFSMFVCFHAMGQETFSEYRRSQACSERFFEKMDDLRPVLLSLEQVKGHGDEAMNQRIRSFERLRKELQSLSMEDCPRPILLAHLNVDFHFSRKVGMFTHYRDGKISRSELRRQAVWGRGILCSRLWGTGARLLQIIK